MAHGRVELETVTTFVASAVHVAVCLALLHQGASVVALLAAFVAIEYAVTLVYFVLIQRYIAHLPLRPDFPLARGWPATVALRRLVAGGRGVRPARGAHPLAAGDEAPGRHLCAALKVADLALMVPQVLMTNVFPILSTGHEADASAFAAVQRAAVRMLLAYAVPLTVGLLLLAEPIVTLLDWTGVRRGRGPLQILAVGLAFGALAELGWRSLAARGAQHSSFASRSSPS